MLLELLESKLGDAEQDAEETLLAHRMIKCVKHNAHLPKKPEEINVNDLVLVYDVTLDGFGRKFSHRYRGPYVVDKTLRKNVYELAKVNGTRLAGTYHAKRLKRFKKSSNDSSDVIRPSSKDWIAAVEHKQAGELQVSDHPRTRSQAHLVNEEPLHPDMYERDETTYQRFDGVVVEKRRL